MSLTLTDREFAARMVTMLVASFPQQPPEPEMYMSQLITLCTGRSRELLERMLSPQAGVVAKARFLPSVAEVKEWLDKNEPRVTCLHPEHRLLPPSPRLNISEEERQRNIAKVDALLAKWGRKSRFPRHKVATPEEIKSWGEIDG